MPKKGTYLEHSLLDFRMFTELCNHGYNQF